MKNSTKFNIISLALLFVLLSALLQEHLKADDWKFTGTGVTARSTLSLTGDDWLFKGTIKKTSNSKVNTGSFQVTVKVFGGSNLLETKTLTIEPGILRTGDTYSFDFSIPGRKKGNSFVFHTLKVVLEGGDIFDSFYEQFEI